MRDLARLREVDAIFEQRFPKLRPELLDYVVGVHDDEDGGFTLAAPTSPRGGRARANGRSYPPRPQSCCVRKWN